MRTLLCGEMFQLVGESLLIPQGDKEQEAESLTTRLLIASDALKVGGDEFSFFERFLGEEVHAMAGDGGADRA